MHKFVSYDKISTLDCIQGLKDSTGDYGIIFVKKRIVLIQNSECRMMANFETNYQV